jgi:predicted secreted hydrolase
VKTKLIGGLILLLCWSVMDGRAETETFFPITGPCHLSFPADHGSHPGYRLEWWYYTGNLFSGRGRQFGFQLTFFRYQLYPSERFVPKTIVNNADNGPETLLAAPDSTVSGNCSAWRTNQLYFLHAALTDIEGKQYLHAEDAARAALNLAGTRERNDTFTVFVKNGSATLAPGEHRLEAVADHFSLDLRLKPSKQPILHGQDGYTLKGSAPEQSSCYYSLSRLATVGTITLEGRVFSVEGLSWMDHEFSSAPLDAAAAGWDWFSLQLQDGSELMLYIIRMQDGTSHPASSGTFIPANGQSRHLALEDFTVEVLQHWESPHTGGVYPAGWRVTIEPLKRSWIIRSNLADQEMQSPGSTGITYWEGSVSVREQSEGRPVSGHGYVELTGYAGGFSTQPGR